VPLKVLINEITENTVEIAYGRPVQIGGIVPRRVPDVWERSGYQMQHRNICMENVCDYGYTLKTSNLLSSKNGR